MQLILFSYTVKYYKLAIIEFLPYLKDFLNREHLSKKQKEEIGDMIEMYEDLGKKIDRFNLNIDDPNKIYDNEVDEIPISKLGLNKFTLEHFSRLVFRMLLLWRKKVEKYEKKTYLTEKDKENFQKLKNLIWPLEVQINNQSNIFSKYKDLDPLIFPGEIEENNLDLSTQEIIESGEDDFIEFKSFLRWDLKEEKVNRELEYVIAKTVSAFLNSEGGKLLIGISDNGKILGIDNDYSTLKKRNFDGFTLHLLQVINIFLGKINHEFIFIKKEIIDAKEICIINIKKSSFPVYVKRNGKEEFFIRASASSQSLSIRETAEYIKCHWRN